MLEWLTKEYWLLPNFSWLGIILTLLVLAVCIVCIVRYRRKKKAEGTVSNIPDAPAEEPLKSDKTEIRTPIETKTEEEEPTVTAVNEPTFSDAVFALGEVAATESEEQAPQKNIKADIPNETGNSNRLFTEENKIKKENTASAVKDLRLARIIEEIKMDKKESTDKIYHISKRKDDNRWQVKAEGAAKAVKLFFTQAEAIEYAKSLAGNQDGRIVIHKEDGSFRKLTY